MLRFYYLFCIFLTSLVFAVQAQTPQPLHPNIFRYADGRYVLRVDGKEFPDASTTSAARTLRACKGNPQGTSQGIAFNFGAACPEGLLYYGFIPQSDSKYPHPVYFKRTADIQGGEAEIPILGSLEGRYDMIGWQKAGKGILGYRLVNAQGEILYDGKIGFRYTEGEGFSVDVTITEGPFVAKHQPDGATIAFNTNFPVRAKVRVGDTTFAEALPGTHHEIVLTGLQPDKVHTYQVLYGENTQTFRFRTAPKPGSRSRFRFAYCSDSRNGKGGGERNVYGTNFYIMKKIAALATQQGAAFMQFSGDLINGYLTDKEEMALQYANWKRAVEPFMHYMPLYTAMGNHEALMRVFRDENGKRYSVDRFPYPTESAEAAFAAAMVNPENGLYSEDGASYDPDTTRLDFPSYRENVYFYTHDNVAMVVLNSNYFYAPSTGAIPQTSGGLHAYIMDEQLKWLDRTIQKLEQDTTIDHVFVTQHTPFFPNGGHVKDDMWYNGNNDFRTYVNGKPLEKGIIERRDELLDILVNQSTKVRALLTGDEHNYARTKISPKTPIYPEGWAKKKLTLSRTIYQINNGAAGAPYYAQEQTPWSAFVSGFTTQNALVFFEIAGKSVRMEVLNPDTLEPVDQLTIR